MTPPRESPPVRMRLRVRGLMYIDDDSTVRLFCDHLGPHPPWGSTIALALTPQILASLDSIGLATGDIVNVEATPDSVGMSCRRVDIEQRSGGTRLDPVQWPSPIERLQGVGPPDTPQHQTFLSETRVPTERASQSAAASPGGPPMPYDSLPKTKEEILDFLKAYWNQEKRFPQLMVGQTAGMVYEIFGDPPDTMPHRERALLKVLNDLEVKLIELEAKLMALSSGFPAFAIASNFQDSAPRPALQAAAEFSALLHSHVGDVLDLTTTSHKILLESRRILLEAHE